MAFRLQSMGQANYASGFGVALHEHALGLPLRWKRPQTIFVNSMSDLFHQDVPRYFIRRVFTIIEQAHWHRFQILTKRAARLAALAPSLRWPGNVWMGVTVESRRYASRIDYLRNTQAATKFVSFEPLLGPVSEVSLDGLQWVIAGGESGPGARPMDPMWVVDIRDRCRAAGIAFFFKQWGGVRRKAAGRLLEGRTWDEMPHMARSLGA
jgi:protein gp37